MRHIDRSHVLISVFIILLFIVGAICVFRNPYKYVFFPVEENIIETVSTQEDSHNEQEDVQPTTTVRIIQFGDLMLDRSVATVMGEKGFPVIFDDFYQSHKDRFAAADIITANLEGPIVENRIATSKEIAFRFDPDLTPQLASYGFNLFTLANNHTVDMGYAGAEETVQHLEAAGIDWYGHQYSIEPDSLFFKKINDKTIAFIGVNDTHPNTDIDAALELVDLAKEAADLVIINMHWGIEYEQLSSQYQRDLAHQFIDRGVDIFIGHHPHVVQEFEVYKGHPIFYSLGNFVFDQYFSIPTQQGLMLDISLLSNGEISLEVLPFKSIKSVVVQMNSEEQLIFEEQLYGRSRFLHDAAVEVVAPGKFLLSTTDSNL